MYKPGDDDMTLGSNQEGPLDRGIERGRGRGKGDEKFSRGGRGRGRVNSFSAVLVSVIFISLYSGENLVVL